MIEAENIVKSFAGKRILDKVSFRMQRGDSVALLGRNGAGKTTLIRLLATLTQPSSGCFSIAGYSSKNETRLIRRNIGVMSHYNFLYGDLTAEENLRFFGRIYDVNPLTQRINELLNKAGLLARQYDRVSTFSRGMQQRLSLVRALLHNPPVLLLDEPFAGLDIQARLMLQDLLLNLIEKETTVLLALHDIDYALQNSQRILLLDHGRFAIDERSDNLNSSTLITILSES